MKVSESAEWPSWGKNPDVSGPLVCALQDPGNEGEVGLRVPQKIGRAHV